jgi:hypothetical protein
MPAGPGPLQAAIDRSSVPMLGRSPGLGFALRFGAAMLPLAATVALAIAALPLYRLRLPHAGGVPPAHAAPASPRERSAGQLRRLGPCGVRVIEARRNQRCGEGFTR